MCMIMDSLAGSGDIVFVCKRRKKKEKIQKKKKKKSVLTFDHFPRGGRGRGGAGQAAFEEPETAVSHRITETHAVLLLSREAADVFFFFFFPQTSGEKKKICPTVAERLSGLTGVWSLERVAQLGLLPAGQ